MAIPTIVGTPTENAGTSSLTVTASTGATTGDVSIVFIRCPGGVFLPTTTNQTPRMINATDSGWTKYSEVAGINNNRLYVFWRRLDGTANQDTPQTGVTTCTSFNRIDVHGAIASGTPVEGLQTSSGSGATGATPTWPAVTTTDTDRLIVGGGAANIDSTQDQFSAPTNANLADPAATEAADKFSNAGTGAVPGGTFSYYGGLASQGSTGDTTGTLGSSVGWLTAHLAVIPVAASVLERSVAVSAVSGVAVSGAVPGQVARSVEVTAAGSVTCAGLVVHVRSAALSAVSGIATRAASVWNDQLADLSAWTTQHLRAGDPTGGTIGGNGGNIVIVGRSETIASGVCGRFVGKLFYKYRAVGNGADTTGILISDRTDVQLQGGDFSHTLAVGIDSSLGTNRRVQINNNTSVSGLGNVPAADDTFVLAITLDETYVSVTVRNDAGTWEGRYQYPRSSMSWTPTRVVMFSIDNRGATGSRVGPVGFRETSVEPVSPKTGLEDITEAPLWFQANGQVIRVLLPKDYSQGAGTPVWIWFQGAGAGSDAGVDPQNNATVKALADGLSRRAAGGLVVCSGAFHGNSFGDDNAVADVQALYDWLDAHLNIGPLIFTGFSQGGLTASEPKLFTSIPIAGIFASETAFDWFHAQQDVRNPAHPAYPMHTEFAAVWGLPDPWTDDDWNASDGPNHDLLLHDVTAYEGTVWKIVGSYADNTVPAAVHAMPFQQKLRAAGIKSFWVEASGDHGDPSQLTWDELSVFVEDLLGSFSTWDGFPRIAATATISASGSAVSGNLVTGSAAVSAGVQIETSGSRLAQTVTATVGLQAVAAVGSTAKRELLRGAALSARATIATTQAHRIVTRSGTALAGAASIAAGPRRELLRAAGASAVAAISGAQSRAHLRSAALSGIASIASTGNEIGGPVTVARSAALSAAASVAGQPQRALHRGAALLATAAVAAQPRRDLQRSASLAGRAGATAAARYRIVSRTAGLQAAASLSGQPQRTLQRGAAALAHASIESAPQVGGQVTRSAALSAAAMISSQPRRELPRSASLLAHASPQAAQFRRELLRSGGLQATATAAASGYTAGRATAGAALSARATVALAGYSRTQLRSAGLTGTATVGSLSYAIRPRSAALSAKATVSAAQSYAERSRNAALSARAQVASSGQRIPARAAAVSARAQVTLSGFTRVHARGAAFNAAGTVQAAPWRLLSRSATASATVTIGAAPQRELFRGADLCGRAVAFVAGSSTTRRWYGDRGGRWPGDTGDRWEPNAAPQGRWRG